MDFFPTAQAAFIADVADAQLNQLVDEEILPKELFRRDEVPRRFAPIASAFANFYVHAASTFTSTFRSTVIADLTTRVLKHGEKSELLSLTGPRVLAFDWSVERREFHMQFSLMENVRHALEGLERTDRAKGSIVENSEILSGTPVLRGTRVPVEVVVASLAAGETVEDLLDAYPSLTRELIDDAKVYARIFPRRGRPPKLGGSGGLNPSWKEVSSKVVRAGGLR